MERKAVSFQKKSWNSIQQVDDELNASLGDVNVDVKTGQNLTKFEIEEEEDFWRPSLIRALKCVLP
jgi:hypothetical protein